MSNINDVTLILKELLIIYGSTTVSSLLFNKLYYIDRIQKSFKNSQRKLKYKDLSLKCEMDLQNVKDYCYAEKIISRIASCIPLFQILFTVSNIRRDKELYNEFFDERMEKINIDEAYERKRFLIEIKEAKIIPPDIRTRLEDEQYMPSENEYNRVKRLNRTRKVLKNQNNIKMRRESEE